MGARAPLCLPCAVGGQVVSGRPVQGRRHPECACVTWIRLLFCFDFNRGKMLRESKMNFSLYLFVCLVLLTLVEKKGTTD